MGQKLTLTDLTTLCSKKNWEDVNQTLLTKKWTYYDSEKGSTYKYNTITWSFNKDYYNDKAQGWFYLYTYEGFPNKISYTVLNKESYSIIQNSISSAGFKLLNSEIEDNEVISTYGNSSYTMKISTEKREDDEWSSRTLTAYNITLIKKQGIYDADNGEKRDYHYGDVLKAEYKLSMGKIDGPLKLYHYNGKLKKIGHYTNGIENGLFKEFDEKGNLEAEYSTSNGELNGSLKTYYSNGRLKKLASFIKGNEHGIFVEYDEYGTKDAEYVMANGMKNGVLRIYKEGRLSVSTTFKDDIKNGQYIEYYYNDESGKLQLKEIGEYINDKKNGSWKLYLLEDNNTERLLKFDNYINDEKNGSFQDIKGDSLILGSYKNDALHGEYKIYEDFMRSLFGGVISTDITKLKLTTEGSYFEGLQTGYWKHYDFSETLRSEGLYSKGKETSEWKYYYTNWIDDKGDKLPYAKELFLVREYANGRLNGKSIRYSYLEEEEYPCSDLDKSKSSLDTCKRNVYQKILETSFYKDDKLNGAFELLDSAKSIIVKGYFNDNLKEGEWLQRFSNKDINDETYFIYQKGNYEKDKREGKWIEYYTESKTSKTFTYKNDELHGEYIIWNQFDSPSEEKQFSRGKLIELTTYDSLGESPKNKYEIYDEDQIILKCKKTDYLDNGFSSQEYYVKKEMDIDHKWFEFIFLMAINKNFDAGTYGYKDGEYLLFNSNDKPIIKGKYYKENKTGLWTFYFNDQNVKIESDFVNNEKIDEIYYTLKGELFSGEFIYDDVDNGIKETRKIKDGLRNGKTVYFDTKTKRTIKKESYKNGELK